MHVFRKTLEKLKRLLSSERRKPPMTLAPLEEVAQQWTLENPSDKNKVTIVKVTIYPRAKEKEDNDDLSKRITHYPPSDRIH